MMKLAFKRSSGFIGNAIDLLSGARGFCHVELVFSDGVSFSSTSLDEPKGVRFKQIGYSHPEEWAFKELEMEPDTEAACRYYANLLVGRPYDYRGVFRFVLPWMKEHPEAYFCSEVVIETLQAGGMLCGIKPWKYGPNHLAKLLGVR